jgi:two-component system phosphate regulon sensor histidine kinase PhoR
MTFAAFVFGLLASAFGLLWLRERRRLKREAELHRNEIEHLRAAQEKELRYHALRLQAVLDSMVEGIVVLDQDHHVVLTNHAAGELFGFPQPATGRALLETVRHHEVAAVANRLANESSVIGYEFRIEGTPSRFLQVNAVALRDRTGIGSGSVFVFHDVTRIRELENVRQDFVANVSHELRTPLSLIKGAAETLIDGAKNDSVALERLLSIIDRHADRLTLLIDDLLLLARLDSDRVDLKIQSVQLRPAVQEVVDDLSSLARARDVTIENLLPTGLTAHVDPERIRQVISNLINNAVKYGRPAGTVKISAETLNDQFVEVCVQDNGPGIPSDARTRIFERFFRADKARSREQGGTGLGLAIVKHVVQAHGGEVRVESEPGHGASFYFTLPR